MSEGYTILCTMCRSRPPPLPRNCNRCRYIEAIKNGTINHTQLNLISKMFRVGFVDDAMRGQESIDFLKNMGHEAEAIFLDSPQIVMNPIYELNRQLKLLQTEIGRLDKQIEVLKVEEQQLDSELAELAFMVDPEVMYLMPYVKSLSKTLGSIKLGRHKSSKMKNPSQSGSTHANGRKRMDSNECLMKVAKLVDDGKVPDCGVVVPYTTDAFGHDGEITVYRKHFEKVFSLGWLGDEVIDSYMVFLYQEFNQLIKQSNIGFAIALLTKTNECGIKKRLEESKKDLILVPHNTSAHWVLAVIHMKENISYYLDSSGPSDVNPSLKTLIDNAMKEAGKKAVLKWVNCKCPKQPESYECGYYVLKFMKEVVIGGVEVLSMENVGGPNHKYGDAHIDEVRTDWSRFMSKRLTN